MSRDLTTATSEAQALNRRGLDLFVRDDHVGALEAFRAAVEADPRCALAWNNIGLLLQNDGRLVAAIDAYDRALDVRPDYPEALANRGRARQAMGDRRAARGDYDRALASANGPFAATVLHNRASLSRDAGDTAAALADLDRALAIDPKPETFVNRAEIRKAVGDLDGASADLDRALGELPRERSATAYHLRGGVRALRDDFRGALADYDVAIGLEPGNHCFHVSRGNARYHLRDPQALADYRVAFRLDPDGAARECVALFAGDARNRPEAVLKNCAQHIRLNPADGTAYLRRAMTLIFLGRADEAKPDLDQCPGLLGDMWGCARLIIRQAARRLTPAAPTVSLDLGGLPSGPSGARAKPAPALRVSYSA